MMTLLRSRSHQGGRGALCLFCRKHTLFWRKTAESQPRATGSLKEDLSPGCYRDGGSRVAPDHHSGEDNEVTVLPLPHKADIAVSFQNHLWAQSDPSGGLPWSPLPANTQHGCLVCLFVGLESCLD